MLWDFEKVNVEVASYQGFFSFPVEGLLGSRLKWQFCPSHIHLPVSTAPWWKREDRDNCGKQCGITREDADGGNKSFQLKFKKKKACFPFLSQNVLWNFFLHMQDAYTLHQ